MDIRTACNRAREKHAKRAPKAAPWRQRRVRLSLVFPSFLSAEVAGQTRSVPLDFPGRIRRGHPRVAN